MTCDDQHLHSGSSYGQVSTGYNHIHIHFQKSATVDICSDDYSTTKKQNLIHNRYLTKQYKPTIPDIHKDAEM